MKALDTYLDREHSTRGRVMFISIAAGAFFGAVDQLVGAPLNQALVLCIGMTGAIEIFGALGGLGHAAQDKVIKESPVFPMRRLVTVAAFASAAIVLIAWVRPPRMEARLLERRLQSASTNPASPQSIQEAKKVLERSNSSNIQLDKNAIQNTGASLIRAAKTEPQAWDVALDFVSYRTSLNQQLPALGNAQQIATVPRNTTFYQMFHPLGYATPATSVGGDVPAASAADIHPLNQSSLNAGSSRGREVIYLQGGGLTLDGMLFKNVVIQNVAIFYSGGPVRLENVTFVNCTFVSPNAAPTRGFADAVLSYSSSVNFAA